MEKEKMEFVKKEYIDYFNATPEFYLDTGGRFEIIGNHTDHNHGLCLVANASLRCKSALSPFKNEVRIISKGYKEFSFKVDDLDIKGREFGKTIALARGTLARLHDLGYKIGGFKMFIDSDIPNGSGVSSSAAIESLFGYAISYLYNDGKISPLVIAQTGQYAENNYFNKPCGLLDQIGTSFDSSNFIDFKDIKNPLVTTLPFNLPVTLYLIKSEGNHSSLTNLYAEIPAGMKKAAKALEGKEFLRDVENVSSIEEKINSLSLTDKEKKIAKHFFIENSNVKMAKKAIEDNDLELFLKAIRFSQETSKNNIENTYVKGEYKGSPQEIIDKVSEFIKDKGAIRIHGGGFKGTVLAFIKNEFSDEFDAYLAKNYRKEDYFKVHISSKAATFVKY